MRLKKCILPFLVIILDMLQESETQITYSEECSIAIRDIGLPRKWRNDSDYENPLTLPLRLDEQSFELTITYNGSTRTDIWKSHQVPLLSCLHQESPQLINHIRKNYLKKKEDDFIHHNLTFTTEKFHRSPRKFGVEQALEVDDLIFKGRLKDGFFIEAGAHDFEDQSTSLYFELKYNWTGLLVEPNQFHYKMGLTKQRRVFSAETCFSFSTHPTALKYSIQQESLLENIDKGGVTVQCFPLYSLLLAVGNPTVNYMSLDIEGGEFQVLKTIPWDKVDIQVISIESHFLGVRTEGSLEEVVDYMNKKGYKHIPGAHKVDETTMLVIEIGGHITNELFVREDIAKEAGL